MENKRDSPFANIVTLTTHVIRDEDTRKVYDIFYISGVYYILAFPPDTYHAVNDLGLLGNYSILENPHYPDADWYNEDKHAPRYPILCL